MDDSQRSRPESSAWYRFVNGGKPVRIGILSAAEGLPAWLNATAEQLKSLPEADIQHLFLCPSWPSSPPRLPKTYQRLFAKNDSPGPFTLSLAAVDSVSRHNLHGAPGPALSLEDRELIASFDLDVLVLVPGTPLSGDCSGLARLGVFSIAFGEDRDVAYLPLYWRPVYEDRPTSAVRLLRHATRFETAEVVEELHTATIPSFHFSLNQVAPAQAASGLLTRNLLRPRAGAGRSAAPQFDVRAALPPRYPGVGELLSFSARKMARSLSGRVAVSGKELIWIIGIRPSGGGSGWQRPARECPFREIVAPPGFYYADPFMVEWESKHWLFAEEWVNTLGRGRLVCMEVRSDYSTGEPVVILESPFHLSYPHVFRHGNDFFMIPETYEEGNVQLYRAVRFPFEWKLEKVLIDNVSLVDTTVFPYEGLWYFFTSTFGHPEEGWLFTSSSLDGAWQYHPANPFCQDIRRLRGAGALFRQPDGSIIRPAQDGSRGYGYAVTFNRVSRLSPTEYEERPIGTLLPTWSRNLFGTHTLNFDSAFEVVDGQRWVKPRPALD